MPRKAPVKPALKRETPIEKEIPQTLHKEVKLIAMAAGGILLLIAVFIPGAAGFIGHFIRNFLVGTLGFGAFILPISLISTAIFTMITKRAKIPFVQAIFVFWFFISLLHIINPHYASGIGVFEYLRAVYVDGEIFGGGIMGAILGDILRSLIGTVGSVIILSAAIIILLVLVTGRSFLNFIGKSAKTAKEYYDERSSIVYEDEEEENYEEDPAPRGARKPRKGQKHAPSFADDKKGVKLFNITKEEMDEIDDSQRVILVPEELEELHQERLSKNPIFAKRESKPKVRVAKSGFVNNPDDIFSHEEDVDYYEPIIHTGDYHDAPVKMGKVLSFSKPQDIRDEIYEEDEVYEDEYDDDFIENEYDEDNYPIEAYEDELFEDENEPQDGPIIKGLVDGAESVNKTIPMYADDDEEALLEYDEYANASIKNEKSTSIPSSSDYENYELPPIEFLGKNEKTGVSAESHAQIIENSRILEETLRSFKVEAKVVEVSVGPTVTRYDLSPGPGVKVATIANLSNDLALSLAAQGIRIEAPIPGKSAVGIEIPNKDPQGVFLREIIEDDSFEAFPSKLAFAVGKDIAGEPVITDIARMPHLLIAGATGSGKSVCINTLIASLLYKARPDEVKLLMIDPKVVELSVYNGIPHLLIPVVTDPKKASGALSWAVAEMEKRYKDFAETGCRELKGYNRYMIENDGQEIPQIVIIIDELADLMMTCKGEVEDSICRLAQKARAAGIHLIVATQRPSVDVITGLIKANIPSRLAFAVSSGTDSRTVLDMYGAEKLLGKGDMLFLPMGQNKPIRVQGGFISDKEVENLVKFLKAQAPVEHTTEMIQQITMPGKKLIEGELDEHFYDAVEFLISKGKGSTSVLQRQFRIGYNRASRLMDDLHARGIIGPEDGVKPRKVTITREEFRELYGN